MPLFPQVAQFFPLILAPGVVALARRQQRLAWIDGPLLVWACVVGAAVLWTLLLAAAMGESITRAVIARGVIMGLTSALADTWATRKKADPPEPDAQVPADAPTVVSAPPDVTPLPESRVMPKGALSSDWGPT